MINFPNLLKLLTEHQVEFLIVGGVAAVIHGSSRLTQDLDIVYRRSPENLTRLEKALAEQSALFPGSTSRTAISLVCIYPPKRAQLYIGNPYRRA